MGWIPTRSSCCPSWIDSMPAGKVLSFRYFFFCSACSPTRK